MSSLASHRVWQDRLKHMETEVDEICFPEFNGHKNKISQDREWCEVRINGNSERIRFHDYGKIYEVPGLYEKLFYDKLKCCSPSVVINLLEDVASDLGEDINELKVLDVGAGNGMVGDELDKKGIESVVGVDIIPEAKEAALRDRPKVYDDYLVTDLADFTEENQINLEEENFNCLTTVAALGFGDIPPIAFLRAFDFIETNGWLAFNIKEAFLHEDDTSGFSKFVHQLNREKFIQIQCYRRYQHRMSVTGEPLYYVAMIAKKLKPVTKELLAQWSN